MGGAPPAEKAWFGQPRGLTFLFLTEMWEKFSFFGMRALLVYYMTKQLLLGQAQASIIYGLYTAFVYFTPLVGGYVADRWLGRRTAVIAGGSIMAAGHFMMAFEPLFYPALATIAVGNGLFLPSLPSQINQLYSKDDPRRASAYNVYYVGINLGAFLAPFACGTVGEMFGWHWGFTLAGIGMVTGLVTYIAGSPYLPKDERRGTPAPTTKAAAEGGGGDTYFLLAAVAAAVVIFRAAYEQTGNTLALWADTGIDRTVGATTIPMTWFQSINPLIIFLLTPVIVAYWTRRAKTGKEQTTVAKMATGAFIVAASYLMLAAIAHGGTVHSPPSWLWLAAFFLIYTIGELFILPVGLGLFGRMAAQKFAATTIAAWFAAAFFGNLAAGALGTLWSALAADEFFLLTGAITGVSGLFLALLVPWARRVEAIAAGKVGQLDADERAS